jgi:uncharacterized protein involved in outer membrane biogenesis
MRILRWVAIAAGILVVITLLAVGGLLYYVSTDNFRSMVAERAGAAAGRGIKINGDLKIDWGRTTRVVVNQLEIGNVDWGSEPVMASAERIDFTIRLTSLLHGATVLPEVTLIRPKLLLERDKKGQSNWQFSQNPEAATAAQAVTPNNRFQFPVIGRLVVRDGIVSYRDPANDININSKVNTATGTATGKEEVRLDGNGTFAGKPFRLDLVGGSLLQLRDTSEPYPIRVEAHIGKTKGMVDGTMQDPVKFTGVDLRLDLAGEDLAQLFPIFGIPLPKTPPYRLAGHLVRDGDSWRFSDMKGGVGDSDLEGEVAIETGGDRPKATADLVSQRLDFDDLATLIGAAPATGPGETATAEQKQEAKERKKTGLVLPNKKVDLKRLRAMDMTVTLDGKQINAPSLPMQNFKAKFQLQNGLLTVEPLSFGIADGHIEGRLSLNGREDIPTAATDLNIRSVKFAEFFKDSKFAAETGGLFGGHIQFEGKGRSTAEILGDANGGLSIFMTGGKFSNLLLELIGVDIAESLGLVLTKDKPVPVRCAVGDFSLRDGLMKSKILVFDTTDTKVTGEGTVNLRDEKLDLKLEAHPKDPSLLEARTPILIRGRLGKPEFGVDPSEAAVRGAAAVALGVLLTPLAALLPMIELGLGKDSPCQKLIAEAQTSE